MRKEEKWFLKDIICIKKIKDMYVVIQDFICQHSLSIKEKTSLIWEFFFLRLNLLSTLSTLSNEFTACPSVFRA